MSHVPCPECGSAIPTGPLTLDLRRKVEELERDVDLAEQDLAKKRREIGHLKGELTKQFSESPEHDAVRGLFELWCELRQSMRRGRRPTLDEKRVSVGRVAVRDNGADRCEQAVRFVTANPYQHFNRHLPTPQKGSARRDDWAYILRDASQVERFSDAWLALNPRLLHLDGVDWRRIAVSECGLVDDIGTRRAREDRATCPCCYAAARWIGTSLVCTALCHPDRVDARLVDLAVAHGFVPQLREAA